MERSRRCDIRDEGGTSEGSTSDATIRSARAEIARGRRPLFRYRAQTRDDGSYEVSVLDVPDGVISVTSRKGVEAAARTRIALLLNAPEDAFDLVAAPKRRRRSSR